MSWKDRWMTGSFRGVPFYTESAKGSGGRNAAVHEFPLQETHQTEDMGKKAGQRNASFFVLGDDYDLAREALITALDAPGPGLLVHADFGTMMIQIIDYDWEISTRRGGYCQFNITYVTAGKRIPPVTRTSAAELSDALKHTAKTTNEDAAGKLDVSGPAHVLAMAIGQMHDAVGGLRKLNSKIAATLQPIDDLSDNIDVFGSELSTLLKQPISLVMEVEGLIGNTLGAFSDVKAAFNAYKNLSVLFASSSPISSTASNGVKTPTREKMVQNQAALKQALQTHATLAMAKQLTRQNLFSTANDAMEVRNGLVTAIDDLVADISLKNDVYAALVATQVAINRRINDIAPGLEKISYHTLNESLPALVLAHRLYGDANRADELVARNRVANPLFLPAGVPIEALL